MKLFFNSQILVFTFLVALFGNVNVYAQTFTDNFDTYDADDHLCLQTIAWQTWSGATGGIEDPYVRTTYAFSGLNSVKIVADNDLVRVHNNTPIETGKWYTSFMFYIPTGKTGYFNALALFTPTTEWAMECYFEAGTTDNGKLFNGNTTPTTPKVFQWSHDTWQKILLVIDLDNDEAYLWLGTGTFLTRIDTWTWSAGVNGQTCAKKLAAIDFWGATPNDEMYLDDFYFGNTFQLAVNVSNGWNMVSIPGLHPVDQNVNTWWAYRDPAASVFKYCSGFQAITTVTPGMGYWMKHAGARTYNTGDEWPASGLILVPNDPIGGGCGKEIQAIAGWNLVGIYEYEVAASEITTNPPGLITGSLYGYSGGYYVAPTLYPGNAYWVKMAGAGEIILP